MAAAGTVTRQSRRSSDGFEITFTWTADASGDVADGGTTGKGVFTAIGYLYSMTFIPGTAADNYDLTLLDSEDIDVLRGQGLNQQQTTDQTYDTKYRSNFLDVDGKYLFFNNENLTFTIANGGNGGTGVVKIKFTRTASSEL